MKTPRQSRLVLQAFAVPLVIALSLAALAMTPAPGPDQVAVVINDNTIDMPDTLRAGTTTFEVTNRGTERHSLAISKNGGEAEAHLDTELGPGETATLEYEMVEGQYRVYCPMDGHRDSQSRNVTVVAGKK
jgi:plastocyanin